MTSLTLFYDGRCPLCVAEMRRLAELDSGARLIFEDINHADFSDRYPHIDPIAANRILHGQTNTGEMLYGLDVSCLAWKVVGKHRWMAALRWPVIRWFADIGYRWFARHRYTLSRYLTGQPRCTSHCENLPRHGK
ncbi:MULTISPECIES: thiol-disulfide oxidoreductase DCC family protein [Spongiibacter]|uniref:thiol-disulfide oxidoreductase DCC family protein n=1 Tax=Spongiibacter TaxID=630749 RepID=UPI0003B55845|nr:MULTISPECIES: DUF393 domain-containing protein [Spongiibacter]MBO6751494.1 DUF393 domain-containing protein [Spongiibacter sp.]